MTEGEIFNVRIEKIVAGGGGIARLAGKSIFTEMTAPGDRIKGRIKKDKKNWAEGELLEILEPSPLRSAPLCAHYGVCGGCSLQHLSYDAQIDAKISILRDAFLRIGGINPPEIRAHKSPPFEYRNRVRFHSENNSKNGSNPRIGFKERRSSRIITLEDCPIADSGIRKALQEGKITPPKNKESFSVYSRGNTFLCEGGLEQGRISILGRELAMDVKVFFQANASMLENLITDLSGAAVTADKTKALADIFCGVGTFASFLCGEFQGNHGLRENLRFPENPGFSEIDLVEESKAALSLARENIPHGKKVNYYARNDIEWVKESLKKARGRCWGFMVLDPPRGGLSGPLRDFLCENGSELLAYVSCDPATLARDSRVLQKGGYTLKELTLYDFYPQTAHIESLAVFTRGSK